MVYEIRSASAINLSWRNAVQIGMRPPHNGGIMPAINVTITPAQRIPGSPRKRRYTVTWEVDGNRLPARTVTMPDDIPSIITDDEELDELYREIALRTTRMAAGVAPHRGVAGPA